jgi:thymidylate synthase (FAD)
MILAEYVSHMGTDLTVVNSARVSFNKESDWELGQLPAQDEKLIGYLAKHNHITPFTHPQITLRESIPIFVARQRFKHVVGFTYNEVSRRYVDDAPDFYMPTEWRERPDGSIKQGSGGTHENNSLIKGLYAHTVQIALDTYNTLIIQGVAPEQARMVLPQSMITSYYVTGSLAAFARAYRQRIDSHAQEEIQGLAKQWDKLIAPMYPVSWAALTLGAV